MQRLDPNYRHSRQFYETATTIPPLAEMRREYAEQIHRQVLARERRMERNTARAVHTPRPAAPPPKHTAPQRSKWKPRPHNREKGGFPQNKNR